MFRLGKLKVLIIIILVILGMITAYVFVFPKLGDIDIDTKYCVADITTLAGISTYTTQNIPNEMSCNLTCVISIIDNMINDGFTRSDISSDDNLLDISLSRDDLTFRVLYYRATGNLLWVCNDMTKNYMLPSYIQGGVDNG